MVTAAGCSHDYTHTSTVTVVGGHCARKAQPINLV